MSPFQTYTCNNHNLQTQLILLTNFLYKASKSLLEKVISDLSLWNPLLEPLLPGRHLSNAPWPRGKSAACKHLHANIASSLTYPSTLYRYSPDGLCILMAEWRHKLEHLFSSSKRESSEQLHYCASIRLVLCTRCCWSLLCGSTWLAYVVGEFCCV